ncbi:MAG: hypothetical protein WCK73_14870 [Deltaproteobacteria bacterium]
MLEILETPLNLTLPLGQHPHCLIAQIPDELRRGEQGYVVPHPDEQWERIRSVIELVTLRDGGFRKLHFLVFPEGCLPLSHLDDMLAYLELRLHPGTVTMFGLEHVPLAAFRALLERHGADNARALEEVDQDLRSGSEPTMPVNFSCVVIREDDGKFRVFLQAKGHPFHGEEYLDKSRDLYRGRIVHHFRGPSLNFMVLICLDYLFRDLFASNIRKIVDHANQSYFRSRQGLDALFVIQANPKPEHPAYRDVLSGFYGEYLEDTPGVRDTVTVFGNCSEESRVEGGEGHGTYGVSSVVIGPRHKMRNVALSEFAIDDFGGAPLCRLRFGSATRLYYFNLPLHHELDPRTTRIPLKVHGIYCPTGDGRWRKLSGDEILQGVGG